MAVTTYIIFEKVEAHLPAPEPVIDEEGRDAGTEVIEAYRKIGAVNTHSTDQALRKAAEQHGSGAYAVVSERSWKTQEFEVETVMRVKAAR